MTKPLGMTWALCGFLFLGISTRAPRAFAQTKDRYLLAQSDPDEAFDPFSDYSEFDEDSEEEADINFFRNGRFFTVGLQGGMRGFTGNFAHEYTAAPIYGLTMTYFFDLRTAMALGFMTGDHSVGFTTQGGGNTYTGDVSLTSINFDFKYYFSTQNVTRGLADLNPYGFIGFAQYFRTYSIDNFASQPRDSTMGAEGGLGVEIPLMRKRGFLGVQVEYHVVSFSDAGKQYITTSTASERLDSTLSGNFYEGTIILGMNF